MPLSQKSSISRQPRHNAQKSRGTGPTSIEGKKKSSQNARRHGVTAQTTVMTEEDRLKHDAFCSRMVAELAPVGEMETFHASSVAEEAWRLNHSRAQCNNIVAIGHFDGTGDRYDAEHPEIHTAITAASTVRDNSKTLELLSLYEQRIHRSFQKHMEQLKKLQAERKAQYDTDLDNARLLSQLSQLRNLPYIPAQDGFVFSNRANRRPHRTLPPPPGLAKEENYTYRKQRSGHWELPKAA